MSHNGKCCHSYERQLWCQHQVSSKKDALPSKVQAACQFSSADALKLCCISCLGIWFQNPSVKLLKVVGTYLQQHFASCSSIAVIDSHHMFERHVSSHAELTSTLEEVQDVKLLTLHVCNQHCQRLPCTACPFSELSRICCVIAKMLLGYYIVWYIELPTVSQGASALTGRAHLRSEASRLMSS